MDRSTVRRCRSHDQMDEATPATPMTKGRPPFRPTCRYNRGALPSLGEYEKFLEEHRRFYDSARKTHEAVVASTSDVAAKRHRGCLEHNDRTSWLGPQWASSTGFQPAARKTIADRKVAVARRRRHVAATNTRRLHDGAALSSRPLGANAQHFSEKTTKKASGVQEVVPGDVQRTGGNKRRSEVTCTEDVGIKDQTPKTKTPRLEVRKSATAGPTDVCVVSAGPQEPAAIDSKRKDTGLSLSKLSKAVPRQARCASKLSGAST
ncbi:hypothetical protein HPB52_023032 [Rhipicephalus sanguineus]|uniref:Uncharacterized protein n=1 Tax=Rhipicephalus sanguineus TaxID=34632 RepID=A0A9D4PGW6_RHISA|nr:hypothetical protein HPB52_023032 [Rhipicephalus sanguineus]